jgi:hypothetical protein
MRLVFAMLFPFGTALSAVHADGCKFSITGHRVPEHEQRAFIEWADGVETLHVAALSDPTNDGTVWIVPIRALAKSIKAEPVEEFPAVIYYETLRNRAVMGLKEKIAVVGVLNSGGLCCPLFGIGGCGSNAVKTDKEVSRIERLGMVVTVVSADSRADLESYLDSQAIDRSRIDLTSLTPYLGRNDYALVCGWVARQGTPVSAAGVRVVFPSPTIWFPLQATRGNPAPVETVVYVRGFVKPAGGCQLSGLRCQYIYGVTEPMGVGQAFRKDTSSGYLDYDYYRRLERLTRVTLTTDPHEWDQDLELEPGATLVGKVSLAVVGWSGFLAPLWSGILGAVLGLVIPLTVIGKSDRIRRDWLAGAVIGALIVFSILAVVVAFSLWRWRRFHGVSRRTALDWLVPPALALTHFAIVCAVCSALIRWIEWAA